MDSRAQPNDSGQELSVRPGTQAGWQIRLEGDDRCRTLGHEAESVLHVQNGMLVAYCVRCEARMEMPWFTGGSAAVLAKQMATEALMMDNPAPSVHVDLCHINNLLCDDAEEMLAAKRALRTAIKRIEQLLDS